MYQNQLVESATEKVSELNMSVTVLVFSVTLIYGYCKQTQSLYLGVSSKARTSLVKG
jgi:hypothetical protein